MEKQQTKEQTKQNAAEENLRRQRHASPDEEKTAHRHSTARRKESPASGRRSVNRSECDGRDDIL